MPFACIFVADFPVEALLRAEPELRPRALAVLEGKPPLQKVFAVNENARQAGVEAGMTKLEVETCPELVLRTRSQLQEAAAHAALLDCAQSFSPRVEDTACDTIVLDLAGMEPLFGPPHKIGCEMARRVSGFGLQASVAIAGNPDTAVLAARGFSGMTVISEGKEAEQLGSLPVAVLFAEETENEEWGRRLETFRRWGIRSLGDLAALPDVALSERLGQPGLYWQQLARGTASRKLIPVEAPLIFEEVIELDDPVVLLEPLAFLLNQLLEKLCVRLTARALATQELRLELELQDGYEEDWHPEQACPVRNAADADARSRPDPMSGGRATTRRASKFSRTLCLPVPLLDSKTFLKMMQLDLKAHPPGAPICKIRLTAEPAPPRATQGGLFLPPSPEPEKLELTLARIAGIVGENNIGSLELLDTHRPEAFRMQRFSPGEPSLSQKQKGEKNNSSRASGANFAVPQSSSGESASGDLVTALRIFRPAVAVSVTLQDGKPARLACARRKELEGEVLWAAGPWRSSGDWWDQQGWARDEWDVAVRGESAIALYRLVRDLLSGGWLVEGTYD